MNHPVLGELRFVDINTQTMSQCFILVVQIVFCGSLMHYSAAHTVTKWFLSVVNLIALQLQHV